MPTSALQYLTRAQASLRRTLLVMDNSPTPRNLRNIIWAASFLAGAELPFNASPAVFIHIRAMARIVVQYVEMAGASFKLEDIMHLIFLDIMTSVLAFRRCQLDTSVWLPRLLNEVWITVGAPLPFRKDVRSRHTLHQSIKDIDLRTVMLSQKSRHDIYDKLQEDIKPTHIGPLCDAIRAEELLHLGQLVNIAVDATNVLENSGLTSKLVQDQSARVYLPIAVQLWIRLTSPTFYLNNAGLDAAPNLLQYLKTAITRSGPDVRDLSAPEETYAAAKLWALSIGVYTEVQRRDTLGGDPICGAWFHETFRKQIKFMQIHSWQDAVTIFEDFLYCDYVKPHISQWWAPMFPGETNVITDHGESSRH